MRLVTCSVIISILNHEITVESLLLATFPQTAHSYEHYCISNSGSLSRKDDKVCVLDLYPY